MILNHKAAIELLVEAPAELHVSRYLLLNLHALLSNNLLPNAYDTGRLRTAPVSVGGTVYMPPAIPQMIEECFDIIVSKAVLIEDPFEQSFFMMVHIPYLQPFIDVNKRVSRLAANIPLIKAGLCPLSFTDVPQQAYVDGTLAVYETNAVALLREVFIWAYRRSCDRFAVVRQTLGPPNMFRLKYRLELQEAVHNVVRDAMTADAAKAYLEKYALQIPDDDRREFIAMAMVELRCLHEGNFMRFRVRLSEFERWQGAQ
jgi:fido (protein-threonine AMPylation protein)